MKNYGLRKKTSYDTLIDYIQNKQPTFKYPDRLATQIMNSRELGNLDKMGVLGMEEQQQNIMKEQQRQNTIRQLSINNDLTFTHAVAQSYIIGSESSYGTKPKSSIASNAFQSQYEDSMGDLVDLLDEEIEADTGDKETRRQQLQRDTYDHLSEVSGRSDISVINSIMASNEVNRRASNKAVKSYVDDVMDGAVLKKVQSEKVVKDTVNDLMLEEKEKAKAKVYNQPSSSSTSQPTPYGINDVKLPRARSEIRKGTKRETDEPEGIPRGKSRAKSRAPKPEPLTDKEKEDLDDLELKTSNID